MNNKQYTMNSDSNDTMLENNYNMAMLVNDLKKENRRKRLKNKRDRH